MSIDSLTALVRTIPDFPKPGIQFRDITTLLADGAGLRELVDHMAAIARPLDPDLIVGVEARGFILAAALAHALGKGFVPVRKSPESRAPRDISAMRPSRSPAALQGISLRTIFSAASSAVMEVVSMWISGSWGGS
jgi:hypothetical protein